ncbi:MAG: ATP-dependent helicase HrpB, partial [Myxococcota bacterium]
VGKTVGYQVRFEERRSRETRILVVTEGILTRRFLDDPLLEGISAVILDEFHERSVHTDLCLALTRELQQVRDDLKLVVMSATLDAAPLARFLGDCPVITSEGRRFPVNLQHRRSSADRPLEQRVRAALHDVLRADDDDGGDILVFLPGAPEIRRTERLLREEPLAAGRDLEVTPLHGSLDVTAQDRVMHRGTKRRVILATNIAETSLTLDGVTTVVDSGLEKRVRLDPRTGLERLETVRISRYSAEQRAGRAGRTAAGRAVRLWTEPEHSQLEESAPPELHRTCLAGPLLQVLAFQPGRPADFAFFEPPPAAHLERAVRDLTLLDAVQRDESGRCTLTPRGHSLAKLPVAPRLGALLLASHQAGVGAKGCGYAALLSERDLRRPRPPGAPPPLESSCDLADRLDLLEAIEAESFSASAGRALDADERAAREIAKVRDQLVGLLRSLPEPTPPSLPEERRLARALLVAFPDRLCVAKGAETALMYGGRGVIRDEGSAVRGADYFVALDVDDGRGPRSRARLLSAVTREDIEHALPHLVDTREAAALEGDRGTVTGVQQTFLGDLLLHEKRGAPVSAATAEAALVAAIAEDPGRVFAPSERDAAYLVRLRFAARVFPEFAWPTVDETWVREHAGELAAGHRSLADVRATPWRSLIENQLSFEQRRLLQDELPETYEVPSGSHIVIDYDAALGAAEAPILAVRLQEVFGLAETPRVARGQVPLLLHLLAPNHRPVQVT